MILYLAGAERVMLCMVSTKVAARAPEETQVDGGAGIRG